MGCEGKKRKGNMERAKKGMEGKEGKTEGKGDGKDVNGSVPVNF